MLQYSLPLLQFCKAHHEVRARCRPKLSIVEETPVYRAIKDGSNAILELLLDNGANLNNEIKSIKAAISRHDPRYIEITETLINRGYAVCEANSDLVLSLMSSMLGTLELVLDHGFDTCFTTPSPFTDYNFPMFVSAASKYVDLLPVVLARGCNVGTTNVYKDTPLIAAAKYMKPGNVKTLFDSGANIDVQNVLSETPLIIVACTSVQYYNPLVSEILVGAGANPDLSDYTGKTALMYADQKGNVHLARLIVENGLR